MQDPSISYSSFLLHTDKVLRAKLTKWRPGRTAILVRLVLCSDPIGGWGKGTLSENPT